MDRQVKIVLGTAGLLIFGAVLFVIELVSSDPGDNLRLVDSGSRLETSGTRFVTGSIRNFTENSYYRVQVEIEFLDGTGTVVGSTTADRGNLAPGETWNLDVPVLPQAAVQALMKNLTCSKTGEEPHPQACYLPVALIQLPGRI